MAENGKLRALYIDHGEHFQLREVFNQEKNPGYQSNKFGVVVEAGEKPVIFPHTIVKNGLTHLGLVIVE